MKYTLILLENFKSLILKCIRNRTRQQKKKRNLSCTYIDFYASFLVISKDLQICFCVSVNIHVYNLYQYFGILFCCFFLLVWLVGFYGVSTRFGSFNAVLNFKQFSFFISIVYVYKKLNVKTVQLNVKIVLFQTIQFSLSKQFKYQRVLFQTIPFNISTQFSSIWPIDWILSGATTLD